MQLIASDIASSYKCLIPLKCYKELISAVSKNRIKDEASNDCLYVQKRNRNASFKKETINRHQTNSQNVWGKLVILYKIVLIRLEVFKKIQTLC